MTILHNPLSRTLCLNPQQILSLFNMMRSGTPNILAGFFLKVFSKGKFFSSFLTLYTWNSANNPPKKFSLEKWFSSGGEVNDFLK